jgi:hypothetical protein
LQDDKGALLMVFQQGSNSSNSWQNLHLVIQTGNNMQGKPPPPPPKVGWGGEERRGEGVRCIPKIGGLGQGNRWVCPPNFENVPDQRAPGKLYLELEHR